MFKQYSENKALKKLASRNDIYAAHKVPYIYGEKNTHTLDEKHSGWTCSNTKTYYSYG